MRKAGGSVQLSHVARVIFIAALFMAAHGPVSARMLGTTWYVTRAGDDGADGDVNTRSGTLRFTLAHAQSGDFVSFANFDRVVDIIDVFSGLVVPAGVAVGHIRNEPCGSALSPLVNIRAQSAVTIVVSLGANATFRNLNIAGGTISIKATGADADICGVGLGFMHDQTDGLLPAPPATAALTIDGAHAVLHQSWVNNTIIVSAHGSDTQIGDAIGGSGDSNQGACGNQGKCSVSVLADKVSAAQRVTIRDPFPRGLLGLIGSGLSGGDDVLTHTNNWAQTPSFASVVVHGTANPLSLVDIFIDDQITLARQAPALADAMGAFTFTGQISASNLSVFAISTLNDPAHPTRVGSSSQWSGEVKVVAHQGNTNTPTPTSTSVTISTATTTPTSTKPQTMTPTPTAASKFTATPTGTGTPIIPNQPTTTATPKATQTPTSVDPDITLSAHAITFTQAIGDAPMTQTIQISTTKLWQTDVTTDASNWLSATQSGNGSGSITLDAYSIGLQRGSYHGTVNIASLSAGLQPVQAHTASISVMLVVQRLMPRVWLPVVIR